jgi:opacity protein-like surface antigen
VIFFCITNRGNLQAQNTDLGNWIGYIGNQKINNHFNFHNELQIRNNNINGEINQLLLRIGLGYNLNNHANILIGYAFVKTTSKDDTANFKNQTNENRIFQQVSLKQNCNNFLFSHRLRIEERFIKKNTEYRFRYNLSINKPLNKSTIIKNTIYASAYDEIFICPKSNFFDRNRIFAGFGYAFNKYIKIEAGYMVQRTSNNTFKQIQFLLFNNTPIKNK